ncbi:MAG: phenylalanine--tRNA ligase subunit beta [Candidatus Aenigmatarchaeota archaeon]
MPKIDVSLKDLKKLVGRCFDEKELEEALLFAKCEIEKLDGNNLQLDVKDSNRPDLWSVEGVAREVAGRFGKTGCPNYVAKDSGIVVNVDGESKIKSVRPYTVCAVMRGLTITEDVMLQIIQLQEKVAVTFGRNRKEIAIGIYDLHKIKSPIKYTTVKPDGIKFIPLSDETATYNAMTPAEILQKHPKGKEFAHLLGGCEEYPIFIDAAGEVLSMPPVINSDHTGKVTEKTKDVFIECSGFELKFLLPALNVMVCCLADRGGVIEGVKVNLPDNYQMKSLETPVLDKKSFVVDMEKTKLSGLNLSEKEIKELLEQARYDVTIKNGKIDVKYPCYRQDIMHWRDVVEDVIISYGYNKIEPAELRMITVGSLDDKEKFLNNVAEILVGCGLQEVLSYNLTNKDYLLQKMRLHNEKLVEIENFVSSSWSVFRNWLIPSALEFLSKNKHNEYPQNVFEIGDVFMPNEKQENRVSEPKHLCVAITDNVINYEQLTSYLDAVMRLLEVEYKLEACEHNSFIGGRVADIIVDGKMVGVIGEIHPQVLNNWEIEKSVASFELNLEELYKDISIR